jgi:hypothetical protein
VSYKRGPVGREGDGLGGRNVPCVRDDDVVEWVVAFAEAREADAYYHG